MLQCLEELAWRGVRGAILGHRTVRLSVAKDIWQCFKQLTNSSVVTFAIADFLESEIKLQLVLDCLVAMFGVGYQ